jgi:hypothetical protein
MRLRFLLIPGLLAAIPALAADKKPLTVDDMWAGWRAGWGQR